MLLDYTQYGLQVRGQARTIPGKLRINKRLGLFLKLLSAGIVSIGPLLDVEFK